MSDGATVGSCPAQIEAATIYRVFSHSKKLRCPLGTIFLRKIKLIFKQNVDEHQISHDRSRAFGKTKGELGSHNLETGSEMSFPISVRLILCLIHVKIS